MTAFLRGWSIWAVSVSLTATAAAYTALHPLSANAVSIVGGGSGAAVGIVFIGAFATVGALLAWKRPNNPIGWLLSAIGLTFAVAVFSVFLAHFPRMLTLDAWLGFLYLSGIGLCVFVLLLFPTGQLPSRRWRPVAWAAGAGVAGWTLGCAFAPTLITTSKTRNPVGTTGPAGHIFKLMAFGGAGLMAVTGLAAAASLAVRYRRAETAERAQLKWLVSAAAVIVVAELVSAPIKSTNLQNAISSGALVLVPLAIGVAVLRYRLYDIDRIISRTLAYAIVTGLLIGIYAGLVLLATEVLQIHSAVAVAAATLIAAALFNPVRRRVQHRVDRRFNRARYDADETVAAFAARLKEAVDLDSVRADLAGVVQTALEPAHVWVWTQDRQSAAAARTAARIASSTPSNGSLPSMRSPLT
jgi:hypothetical protein